MTSALLVGAITVSALAIVFISGFSVGRNTERQACRNVVIQTVEWQPRAAVGGDQP